MQDVLTLAREARDITTFAKAYFRRLCEIFETLDFAALASLVSRLEDARVNDRMVFVAGNGGSATTATCMANDLGFDVLKKAGTARTFRMHSLTDNNAVLTAISNDVGYDRVFVDQMRVHFREGDVLIVISASGDSPNVVNAAQWARQHGGTVVALLGFEGGRLASIADVVLHFASTRGEYGPVEDAHLVLNHILAHWFQEKLRGEAG